MESYTCQTRVDDISNVRKDCMEGAEGIGGCGGKRSDPVPRQEPIGHDDELSEEPEELLQKNLHEISIYIYNMCVCMYVRRYVCRYVFRYAVPHCAHISIRVQGPRDV